jgi:arsenite-transporting ATPase
LERAGIAPFAWVVNQSFDRDGFSDPILIERGERERPFLAEVREQHSRRMAVVQWEPIEPVGVDLLLRLAGGPGSLSVLEPIRG